jgi:hypothetical protein
MRAKRSPRLRNERTNWANVEVSTANQLTMCDDHADDDRQVQEPEVVRVVNAVNSGGYACAVQSSRSSSDGTRRRCKRGASDVGDADKQSDG